MALTGNYNVSANNNRGPQASELPHDITLTKTFPTVVSNSEKSEWHHATVMLGHLACINSPV
jgi:hypothetical protein